jgi:hypothetical protein
MGVLMSSVGNLGVMRPLLASETPVDEDAFEETCGIKGGDSSYLDY